MTLDVLGHAVHAPEACANVARFGFADLCEIPLGPADFLALARQFHSWSSMRFRLLALASATKPNGSSR
jgi:predicted ATPase